MLLEAIRQNIEYFSMSNRELSLLAGVEEKTIRNILKGETSPSLITLDSFEKVFNLEVGDLVSLLQYSNSIDDIPERVISTIEKSNETYSILSIKKMANSIFNGSLKNYKSYVNSLSPDYYKFKESDLAYLWIASTDAKIGNNHPSGVMDRKNKTNIIKKSLEILFKNSTFDDRVYEIKSFLSINGIMLVNSPFIKGSGLRGVTFKKKSGRYIYMNDNGKREHYYIFTLMHEILHVFNGKNVNNNDVANIIEKYLEKYDIKHEIQLVINLYKQSDLKWTDKEFSWIHDNTKLKIDFGSQDKLLKFT